MRDAPSPAPAGRPTRVRHGVLALAMALGMVTYLDRACIGALAPAISLNLALSKDQMSWVFSAFALAYAFFELPTAAWADRCGARRALTRIVLWWSAFTVATAAAVGYGSLLVIRFLFGVGEAGAWPCVALIFARWVPPADRGRVQGIFFAAAHLSGALTPMLALALVGSLGWRPVFVCFGLVGVLWVSVWCRLFRDDPARHPGVNPAELALVAAGRAAGGEGAPEPFTWRRLLLHRNTLPLCLGYVPNSCGFYFCITWLPTYLAEKHHFTSLSLGFFAGLPLLVAVPGDLLGGMVTDAATRHFGPRLGRAGVCVLGNLVAGLAMIGAAFAPNPYLAIGLISLAICATMFTLGATWATCVGLGGSHVGKVSATMNTAGQIGSVGGPLMVTGLLHLCGDWNAPVFAIGGLFLLGALCWCLIDPRDRIFG